MTARPPRFSIWLLQRCLRGRHVESLIGDLLELHPGRSSGWYWRQVFTALFVGGVDAVRASRRSLILALAVGWGALVVWVELNAVFIAYSGDIYRSLRAASLDRNEGLLIVWCLGATLRLLCFIGIGWLVARLNARHAWLAVALFFVSVLVLPIPWEQVRVLEHGLHRWAYYVIALAGMALGAAIVSRASGRYSTITGS